MSLLSWISLGCAALPAALFLRNLTLYRVPRQASARRSEFISVLLPARNEAANIVPALQALAVQTCRSFEVVVLDDHSSDDTALLVEEFAAHDPRVRLVRAPELPAGWCGKQHACWVLAQQARYSILLFVDADVRLEPEALARIVTFMNDSGVALVSGVPRQVTRSWLETLLIPLIHFVLLGFLPLDQMRRRLDPSLGAGCGQLFAARREPYFQSGGHRAIRESLHDGVTLPRAFRRAGFATDLFDATPVATCRMYASAGQVWHGLAKNATEGLASNRLIVPMTLLLGFGQVFPWIAIAINPAERIAWVAAAVSLLPRLAGVSRFHQSVRSAVFHPVGVTFLLAIQWFAWARRLRGRSPEWRGRAVAPVKERQAEQAMS